MTQPFTTSKILFIMVPHFTKVNTLYLELRETTTDFILLAIVQFIVLDFVNLYFTIILCLSVNLLVYIYTGNTYLFLNPYYCLLFIYF
jgi:hypothetical protein